MKVTDEMLAVAVKQAVKEGLLPKHGPTDKYMQYWGSIRKILEVAIAEGES